MANIASAKKRARQNVKRNLHRSSQRSRFRSSIRKVVLAIQAGDLEQAQNAYRLAVPVMDSLCDKGVIHKNKVARHKSRLNRRLHALQQG